MPHRLALLLFALLFPAAAHVGVNDVFFEGQAGPYPLYVTVRPPLVIPGVAEVSIRSSAADVSRIRITPMTLTGAGSKFPPTPDPTTRSTEDPQTFTGSLWIMSSGMWQVRLMVDGARGSSVLSVPVPATSQRVTTMDKSTGAVLILLVALLVIGAAGIAGAALGESVVPPGDQVPPTRRRLAQFARIGGMAIGLTVVALSWNWWGAEATSYGKSVYKPLAMSLEAQGRQLNIQLAHTGWFQKETLDDLILDHGHPMHLYLLQDPDQNVAYHLHPKDLGAGKFQVALPQLPAGRYQFFADIVHRSGFPETLRASLELPALPEGPLGPDDAGLIAGQAQKSNIDIHLNSGLTVHMDAPTQPLKVGQPTNLRFRILDASGNPAPNLKPYLGMPAHLAIVSKDFSVFAHIHPSGSISMPAFELAQKNLLPMNSNVLISSHSMEMDNSVIRPEFSFPFGFPQQGSYRLVLQFRTLDRVETAQFTSLIAP